MAFWQGGDLREFDAVHADGFVDRSAAGRQPDKAGFREGIEELYREFPDFSAATVFIAVDERLTLATVCWSATGGTKRFSGIEVIRCQTGQVVERWGEWDGGAG